MLTFLLLCTGHWYLLITNLPVVVWQIREVYRLPPGNMGIYDPTEIHNRGMVKKHLKDCMVYLGFFLILFFIYVYWYVSGLSNINNSILFHVFPFGYSMIHALLEGDPIRRHEEEDIITEF